MSAAQPGMVSQACCLLRTSYLSKDGLAARYAQTRRNLLRGKGVCNGDGCAAGKDDAQVRNDAFQRHGHVDRHSVA